MGLMALGATVSQNLQDNNYFKAAEDNSWQIEKFLMENDKNWDHNRHCDWIMLMPNPHLIMGATDRTSMILDVNQATELDLKGRFNSSVCLLVLTAAQNRTELEDRLALGKNITFLKGKLAMVVMSDQMIDLSNMTKVTFPTMVLEPDRQFPRDGIHFLA